jgi:hypothetical protein
MSDASERASEFESFLAELSTRLTGLAGDRVDAEVDHGLRSLAEFLDTDRATLFEFGAPPASVPLTPGLARLSGRTPTP